MLNNGLHLHWLMKGNNAKETFMRYKWLMCFSMMGVFMTLLSNCKTNNHPPLPLIHAKKYDYLAIAHSIKNKYDQHLDTMPQYQASHYAARIFRISGDTSYLKYNLRDLQSMYQESQELLIVARNHGEVQYAEEKIKYWSSSKTRFNLRRQTLKVRPQFLYYLSSLNILRRTQEYRIRTPVFEELKQYVLAHDYTTYLNNPEMVKAWAAQLANLVIWLKQLGGKDYSKQFIDMLQKTYPDNQDTLLDKQQYENKIYGLTHLVLAQSRYYQYPLDRMEFPWIFDYFDTHIDTILSRTKADVIAEVGIAYLITQQSGHPALEKTQENIADQYDATQHMIPGPQGEFAITSGAHRNILSIILLSSPSKWYSGPWLDELNSR